MDKEKIKYAPLRKDRIFKGFFSRNKNKRYLIELINNYLPIDIREEDDIEYRNTEIAPENIKGKMPRTDILIKVKSPYGEIINIEIQVENRDNLLKRINYYNSKSYNEQMEYGQDYGSLANVVSLVFVFHDVFTSSNDKNYINNVVYVHKESGKVMEHDRRLCFVELGKYNKDRELYEKDKWAEFLIAENEDEFKELEKEGGIMAEAVKELEYFTKEYKDRYWDDMYKKAELDYISDINSATRKGISIGRSEGICIGEKRGKVEGMLLVDIPTKQITELTGATEEEIEEIRKNMK